MLAKDLLVSLFSITIISWSSYFITEPTTIQLQSPASNASFLINCAGNTGTNFFEEGNFGADTANVVNTSPNLAPDFNYTSSTPPFPGEYIITNNTASWNDIANAWINIGDNSTNPNGYMMVVNGTNQTGVFYEKTFELCENNTYELSIDFINLLQIGQATNNLPNISFLADNVEIFNTTDLPQNESWETFVTTFSTAVGQQEITISLQSNNLSDNQVFALDNISIKSCGPEINVTEINPVLHCPNESVSFEISVGPEYPNPSFQWQISLDDGSSWTNFGAATDQTILDINSIPYNARYRALVANADSNIVLNNCVAISNEVIPAFAAIDVCAQSIVDLDDRCSGLRGENILPDGDFGSGTDETLQVDPGFAPGYTYATDPPPSDGFYTIANNTTSWGSFAQNGWINIGDNSNDNEGYMMVVNATVQPGVFFQRTVDVCENTNYEFSVDVINVVEPIGAQRIQPLVDFQIDGVSLYSTGNVPQDGDWHTYGFSFTTAPGVTEVTLSLINNAPGGIGNDLALDNISFLACGPEVTTGSISADAFCPGDTTTLSIEIGPGLDDPVIQWQISLDNGQTWADLGTASTDTFVTVESLVFDALYRALVAESFGNLDNIACSALSAPISLAFQAIDSCYSSPIENINELCSGLQGPELLTEGNFGTGTPTIAPSLADEQSDYTFNNDSIHLPNNYSIVNNFTSNTLLNPEWISLTDQSGNSEDYFMIVNADDQKNIIYQTTFSGLCENTTYQFSTDIINLVATNYGPFGADENTALPNLDLIIAPLNTKKELLAVAPANYNTGDITNDGTWNKFGFTFNTLPGQTDVILAIRNNSNGSFGNDFAIDNISLRTCFGETAINSAPICEGESLTLDASFDSNLSILWQESTDGGQNWNNLTGETTSSLFIANPVVGNAYRIAIAQSATNLNLPNCLAYSEADTVITLPHIFSQIDTAICEGDSFIMAGNSYNNAGTFMDTLMASNGCDSIITLNLSLIEPIITPLSASICEGDQYQLGDSTFVESGNYNYTFTAANGCDSIVQLELALVDEINSSISQVICIGDNYSIGDSTFTESGIYTVPLVALSGCDSIVQLDLEVVEAISTDIQVSICEGESYTIGNNNYDTAGNYVDTLVSTSTGCDSIISLELSVIEAVFQMIDSTICQGESVIIGSNSYSQSGTFQDTLSSSLGCDSIVTLNLEIIELDTTFINETICFGDSIEIAGEVFSESGNFSISLQNEFACDSTLIIDIEVLDPSFETLGFSICESESITVNDSIYNEAGTFVQIIQAANGCDSILTIEIISIDESFTSLDAQICEGESYDFNGTILDMQGQYLDTLTNANGCDSIIELNLVVFPIVFNTIDTTICANESIVVGMNTYSTSGTFVDTLMGTNCDSIVTLNLEIIELDTTFINETICFGDSIEIAGEVFSESGNFSISLQNEFACDSTLIIDIEVLDPSFETLGFSICESESITVNDSIYNEAGTFVQILQAANGCDSTLTIEIISIDESFTSLDAQICEGESYDFNGTILDMEGQYLDTLTNANGCDSIIELNLTVFPIVFNTIDTTICANESIVVGMNTYSTTGTFIDTLMGVNCDSIITLNLTVLEEINTNIEANLCEGEVFEIEDFSFDAPGDYVINLISENSCDSTINLSLLPIFPSLTNLIENICEGESYSVGNSSYDQTGIYSDTLQAANGCDSIITLDLTVLENVIENIEVILCQGDTYNGQTYTSSTTVSDTYTAANGCDSTVVAQLLVSQLESVTINGLTTLCQGNPTDLSVGNYASYLWSTGQQSQQITVSQAGIYSVTVSDELGCSVSASIEVFDEGIEAIITTVDPNCALGTDGAIYIDAVLGGNAPYQYFINDLPMDSTFEEGLAAGIYEILVIDQAGCEYLEEVQVNDPVPFTITLGPDQELLLPDSIRLNPTLNSIPDSISWSPSQGLSCDNCLDPVAQPSQTTTYTLTIIDINGCIASAQITIEVDQARRIFRPNVFSPNDDGFNDIFSIQTGPEFVEIIEMQIFDRWGSQIWQARGLSPQNASEGWNGKVKGTENAAAGVYVYFAELRYYDGRTLTIKGDISLIR